MSLYGAARLTHRDVHWRSEGTSPSVIVLRQLVVGCPSSPLQTITDASGQGKTKALRYTVLTPVLLYLIVLRSRGPIWLKVATVPCNVSRRHRRPSEHHRRSMTVLREANRQAWTTWRWRDLHAPRGNGLGCLATTTAPIRHSFCDPASRCRKSPQAPPVSCSSAGRWCHDRSAVCGGADPVRQPRVD